MTSSLFSFCPQSAHFRRYGGCFGEISPAKQSSKPPNETL